MVTEKILDLISHFYTYPIEQLDKRPESCRVIETYDNLVSDPGAFVKNIYDRFGFTISLEYQQYLNDETEKSKKYQSKHSYSLDQYGLKADQVIKDFKPIFDRFGFETGN